MSPQQWIKTAVMQRCEESWRRVRGKSIKMPRGSEGLQWREGFEDTQLLELREHADACSAGV